MKTSLGENLQPAKEKLRKSGRGGREEASKSDFMEGNKLDSR
jgi:hypothetical protein